MHENLSLWSILYKFIVLGSPGHDLIHFGFELKNVSLHIQTVILLDMNGILAVLLKTDQKY